MGGSERLLSEEATELAAGGVEGPLFFFGVAVVDQRSALVVNDIEEHSLHRDLVQGRGFVEVTNDFSAQHPQVVDVLADGLPGKVGPHQMFQEWPEASDELFSRRNVFSPSHPGMGPLGEIAAVVGKIGMRTSGGAVYGGDFRCRLRHDSRSALTLHSRYGLQNRTPA